MVCLARFHHKYSSQASCGLGLGPGTGNVIVKLQFLQSLKNTGGGMPLPGAAVPRWTSNPFSPLFLRPLHRVCQALTMHPALLAADTPANLRNESQLSLPTFPAVCAPPAETWERSRCLQKQRDIGVPPLVPLQQGMGPSLATQLPDHPELEAPTRARGHDPRSLGHTHSRTG